MYYDRLQASENPLFSSESYVVELNGKRIHFAPQQATIRLENEDDHILSPADNTFLFAVLRRFPRVRDDIIIDVLWPAEVPNSNPGQSLRTALSRIKSRLDEVGNGFGTELIVDHRNMFIELNKKASVHETKRDRTIGGDFIQSPDVEGQFLASARELAELHRRLSLVIPQIARGLTRPNFEKALHSLLRNFGLGSDE